MIGHQTNFHTSQKAPRYMQDSTLQHNGDNRWSRRAKSCNPIHFNNQRPPPIGIHDHGQISSWLVRCSKSTMPPPRGPRCRAWPMMEETFPIYVQFMLGMLVLGVTASPNDNVVEELYMTSEKMSWTKKQCWRCNSLV